MGGRRSGVLVGLVAVMLVVAALPALAGDGGAQPRTVPFRVSGPGATGIDHRPAVDINYVAGNALVVWADTRSGTSAIWGRLVSLAGVPLGNDFQISRATDTKEAYDPAVAYNNVADQYLVVWSYDTSDTDTDILGQRVRANGSLAGPRMGVAGSNTNQYSADVAFNSWRNHYLVVWVDNVNGKHDIMGRRIRGNGNVVGLEIPVATAASGASGHDYDPAVSFNTMKGTYQVVWSDGRWGPTNFDIFAQRVRSNGNLVGTSFGVSTAVGDQFEPDIAFDPFDMEWYVVWSDGRNRSIDIYGQLTSSYSRLRGGQRRIGLGRADDRHPVVSRSFIAATTAQRYLVAWTDTRSGIWDFDIRGRHVSSHGLTQGTADFLIDGASHSQYTPAMPVFGNPANDTYVVVWMDTGSVTPDIWGRIFP